MPRYYMLKQPTGSVKWDYFLLYIAAKLKKFYIGTYYIPRYQVLAPVFRITPGTPVDLRALDPVPEDVLRESYRMLCVECGWCCVRDSGAFVLENELKDLRDYLDRPLDFTWVETLVGPLKVYHLDLDPGGKCIFYEGRCRLPPEKKPIICLIHYCSLFAERQGRKYVKIAAKRVGEKKVVPIYREVSEEEFRKIVDDYLRWRRGERKR